MHDSHEKNVGELRAQLEAVQQELAVLRSSRRRRRDLGLLAVAVVAASAATALAGYTCSGNSLPLEMLCFTSGTPALASDVNGNFKIVGDFALAVADAGVQTGQALSALTVRVSSLEARAGALEYSVNGDGGTLPGSTIRTGLANRPRILSGSFAGGIGGCGQSVNSPCNVNFNGYFSQVPQCVGMARAPDTSGYSENVVASGVSLTGVSFWDGQYVSGVNLIVDWICVGF